MLKLENLPNVLHTRNVLNFVRHSVSPLVVCDCLLYNQEHQLVVSFESIHLWCKSFLMVVMHSVAFERALDHMDLMLIAVGVFYVNLRTCHVAAAAVAFDLVESTCWCNLFDADSMVSSQCYAIWEIVNVVGGCEIVVS